MSYDNKGLFLLTLDTGCVSAVVLLCMSCSGIQAEGAAPILALPPREKSNSSNMMILKSQVMSSIHYFSSHSIGQARYIATLDSLGTEK